MGIFRVFSLFFQFPGLGGGGPRHYKTDAILKPMSFLFGGAAPTTSELAQRYKRHINRSIRELDRESMKLVNEEKMLMAEVKKASQNNLKQSMQKAQAVVRTRQMQNKFSQMKAHLQGIACRIQNVKSTQALQQAVGSAVQMMRGFNKLGGAELVGALHELEKQNSFMTTQSEMIDEQLDSVFEEDTDGEEINDVVLEVMREAGVELPSAGTSNLSFERQLESIRPPVRS